MLRIRIYTPSQSSRLIYVLDWIFNECLGVEYLVAGIDEEPESSNPAIAYGATLAGAISIPSSGILFETGIKKTEPDVASWQDIPVLFAQKKGGYSIEFDLFGAVFYLLSRYEEYYSYTPDKYGRYPHTEGILFKTGNLSRPLADEWIASLKVMLMQKWGLPLPAKKFKYLPTYDIDMAYSHMYKGVKRIAGAYLRALLKGHLEGIAEKTHVLKKKKPDPYDSFQWMHELHKSNRVRPKFFILAAHKTTPYDKNIRPSHPAMVRLVRQLSKDGDVGVHPSYFSDKAGVVQQEKQSLENIIGSTINISRQHYIRFQIPATPRLLIEFGINEDYSMGYGACLGFRAGTGRSFLWYDLEKEATTALRLHPFCFMDSTAAGTFTGAKAAFTELEIMKKRLAESDSELITIFHNSALGTAAEWAGWQHEYEAFMRSALA